MALPIKDLAEYKAALQAHDWTYEYSDDHFVYKAGLQERGRLSAAAWVLDPTFVVWNSLIPSPEFSRSPSAKDKA